MKCWFAFYEFCNEVVDIEGEVRLEYQKHIFLLKAKCTSQQRWSLKYSHTLVIHSSLWFGSIIL